MADLQHLGELQEIRFRLNELLTKEDLATYNSPVEHLGDLINDMLIKAGISG